MYELFYSRIIELQSKSFPYVAKDEKDTLFSVTVIGLFDC